jgi:hypothetical protein
MHYIMARNEYKRTNALFITRNLTAFLSRDQVQKHVDIRMDAYTTYINTLLEKACKIVTEQFSSSSFGVSDNNLPELSSGGFMCGTATDALSSSVFHQLSVSSNNLHSPGGKPSPSGIEGQLLLQRSTEFKRKSSC